jgi:predicted acetyltransferase
VLEDEIYLRVLKSNIASFKVITNNGGYLVGEDEEHYLLRIKK